MFSGVFKIYTDFKFVQPVNAPLLIYSTSLEIKAVTISALVNVPF